MATKHVDTQIMIMAPQFAINAENTGNLLQRCDRISQAMDVTTWNEASVSHIWKLITDLGEEKNRCKSLMESSSKLLDSNIVPIFHIQSDFISNALNTVTIYAISIKDRVVTILSHEIKNQFRNVVNKLNTCRQNPTEENFKSADQEISDLAKRVQDIRSLEIHFSSTLDVKMDLKRSNWFNAHVQNLEKLIAAYAPEPENLFACLKVASQRRVHKDFQEQLQKEFDQYFESNFSSELITALDHKIFELAPEPKNGKDWGKLHRYDDLNRFKQALFIVLFEDFEENRKDQITNKEFSKFYEIVLRKTYGPKVTDARRWVQSEFPFLIGVIDSIFQKFLERRKKTYF